MKNKSLSSRRRGILILIPVLAVALAVSGCGKKETPKPVAKNTNAQPVNQNINSNTSTNMDINTNTNIPVEPVPVENGGGEEIDTSDWQTYRNEEYGFEVKYPVDWIFHSEDSDDFIPNDEDVIFKIKFFENKNNLEIEEWVDQNDFFNLRQYENAGPDVDVPYGVDEPINIILQDQTSFKLYYSSGVNGMSSGIAITKIDNELIIFSYSVGLYKVREKEMKIFRNVIQSFRIFK